ncbi:acyltransferase 3 [Mariannaea sp. PMI_226]|nr:acyltransferase 3 [Mariannaea sp. PMI_226]
MSGPFLSKLSLALEEPIGLLDKKSLYPNSESENAIGFLKTVHLKAFLARLGRFFIPSFLQGRHMREQIRPAKIHPTAYLDGIRGLAALFVFFCHYTYQGFHIAFAWGFDGAHTQMMKLPFIRLWYSGPAWVTVFFVISGYALSYKPLRLIRSRNHKELSNVMASTVFRRFFRLFAPTTVSTLLVLILIRLGLFELTREFAMNPIYHRNIMEPHPERFESGWAQFWDWLWATFKMIHVFDWDEQGGRNPYDVHLWTIPMEYRCSLYLFLVIVGTARLQTIWRYITIMAVMAVSYRNSRWELLMFLFGMGIAEWDHIRGAHTSPISLPTTEKQDGPKRSSTSTSTSTIGWHIVCIVGLYLLSFPDDGWDRTPGWVYLSTWIPAWWEAARFRLPQGIGGAIFIFGVSHSPAYQRFFNSPVVQYFGKISYSLYVMHGPVMHVIGYHWEKMAWSITGVEGEWYTIGWVLGACFCVPSVIWCADIFWRAVDIPSVKLARWIESKLIVKED